MERSLGRPGGRQARLGGFWDLVGASEELWGRFLDLLEAQLEPLGTTLGDLGVDFLKFLDKLCYRLQQKGKLKA